MQFRNEKPIAHRVRDLLDKSEKTTIGQTPHSPGELCAEHTQMVRRVATLATALAFIAEGIDGLHQQGQKLWDAIDERRRENGAQNASLAALRTQMVIIGALGGVGGSMVVGVAIVLLNRLVGG